MKLYIAVPFPGAEQMVPVWANDENKINFHTQPSEAVRCTLSFAAMEIKNHLSLFFPEIKIQFTEKKTGDTVITFANTPNSKADSFTLKPIENGVEIIGTGRTGALYGAYELLRQQGIRWLTPWDAPQRILNSPFKLPAKEKFYAPSMPLGRGFVFSGCLKESAKLFLWMARNRLNMGAYRMNAGPMQNKLGMTFKDGGHIFEKILSPDRSLPGGKTLWETHPDWYGKPAEGVLTKETALSNQFCVSKTDLLDFLSEELITGLTEGVWRNTDRLEIAGFDTWGNACSCDACVKLGNSTDRHLHFISYIRKKLDEATECGRLNRKVVMALDVYEGTATLSPPQNGVPENLRHSGDYIIHYPIRRCYEHTIDDEGCSYNNFYYQTMKGWENIPSMIGEYYNVSKFEDLPILFTETIPQDIRSYKQLGIQGITYMHLPIMHWGVRAVTQLLYAQMSWDTTTDTESFLQEYFTCRYGEFAAEMRRAYHLIEQAWKLCSSWRAWCGQSILSNLMSWDGKKPVEPLYFDDHFQGDMPQRGHDSVEAMRDALAIMKNVRKRDTENFIKHHTFQISVPVNPTEVCFGDQTPPLYNLLGEDIRGVEYGMDVMALMSAYTEYYELLYKDAPTENIWEQIEQLTQKLDGYYVPITFTSREVESYCYDALTRTQLKPLYFRCKQYRLNMSE